ncbi:hypothetical protein ACO0RG_002521 [Hanseniaspora osmophila]
MARAARSTRSSKASTVDSDPESMDNATANTKNQTKSATSSAKRDIGQVNVSGSEDEPDYYSYMPVELTQQMSKLKKSSIMSLIEQLVIPAKATTTTSIDPLKDDSSKIITPPVNPVVQELRELIRTWEYQYCVTWMYCTFPSFYTRNRNGGYFTNKKRQANGVLNGHNNNDVNSNLKFHEFLLLQDLGDYLQRKGTFYSLENDADQNSFVNPLEKDDVFLWVLMEVAKVYHNDKSIGTTVSSVLKHGEYFSSDWNSVGIVKKFQILFTILKTIELKNIGLRNYIQNNQDLWYFQKYNVSIDLGNGKSSTDDEMDNGLEETYMCMHGGKVIKIEQVIASPLKLPLRLEHCVESQVDEYGATQVSYTVDYYTEIDKYCESIENKYTVLAFEFESLVDFNSQEMKLYPVGDTEKNDGFDNNPNGSSKDKSSNHDDDDDYTLCRVLENQIFGIKLFNNRVKQREVTVMLSSRKRSNRLVALEEDKIKKTIDDAFALKLNYRKGFMKRQTSKRSKILKLVKNLINDKNWVKFDQLYVMKLQEQGILQESLENLGQYDDVIMNDLSNDFNSSLFTSPQHQNVSAMVENDSKYETVYQELPDLYSVNESDLDKLYKHGLSHSFDVKLDNKNWLFNCTCSYTEFHELCDDKDLNESIINKNESAQLSDSTTNNNPDCRNIDYSDIICCDRCHRWSHYGCAEKEVESNALYKEILELINQSSESAKDYATVKIGESRQNVDETEFAKETTTSLTPEVAIETPKPVLTDEDIVKNSLMRGLDVDVIVPRSRRSTAKNVSYTKEKTYSVDSESDDEDNGNEDMNNDGPANSDSSKPLFLKEFPLYDIATNRPLNKLITPYFEDEEYIENVVFHNFKKFICVRCLINLEHFMKNVQFKNDLHSFREKQLRNMKQKQKREMKKKEVTTTSETSASIPNNTAPSFTSSDPPTPSNNHVLL